MVRIETRDDHAYFYSCDSFTYMANGNTIRMSNVTKHEKSPIKISRFPVLEIPTDRIVEIIPTS